MSQLLDFFIGGGQDKCSTRVKRYCHRIHKEEQKPYVTKESTKEGTKHRVRQRCKESTELANHPKQEHEGCSILYNPATSNLHENKKESTLEKVCTLSNFVPCILFYYSLSDSKLLCKLPHISLQC